MNGVDNSIEVLNSLGLTALQAKTYLAIGKLGQTTIRTIAKTAQIDRAEVYRAVYELQKIGLIEKMITAPISFEAIPLKDGLQILLNRKTEEFKVIEEKTKELSVRAETFNREEPTEDGNEFIYVPDDEAMWRHFLKRIKGASQTYDQILYAEVLDFFMAEDILFTRSFENGIALRFLTNKLDEGSELEENIRVLQKEGPFEVRYIPISEITPMRIIDGKEAFICTQKTYNFSVWRARARSPPFIWSNNENLVTIAKEYFDRLWKAAARIG